MNRNLSANGELQDFDVALRNIGISGPKTSLQLSGRPVMLMIHLTKQLKASQLNNKKTQLKNWALYYVFYSVNREQNSKILD